MHLKNIYNEGELLKEATTEESSVVAVISVGYRVNSTCATQFRQWATSEFEKYRIIQDSLYQSDFDKDINGFFDR